MYAMKHVLKVIEDVWSANKEPLAFCTRCYACKKHALFLLDKGQPFGNPLLFVHSVTRVKSISFFSAK
jgi:hypothetical protein